ncbi:MAG: DUF4830 domain-containing protein [Syntrophomonas sp.]
MPGRVVKVKACLTKIAHMSVSKALLVLFVLAAIVVLAYKLCGADIIEGEVSDIKKMVVIYEPCLHDPLIINIEDKTDIRNMYKLIKTTCDRKTIRYPRHSESIQTDSRFQIDIEYNNGKVERISSSENPTCIYRKLDTRGSSGDPGFVFGSNEKLWDYIKALFSNDLTYRQIRYEKAIANSILTQQIEIVRKFVADQGYKIFLNSEANATIWLPSSFSDAGKEFPNGERICQMNELSKQNGYNFSGYLGEKVALLTCSVEKNGNESVHINIIMDRDRIVGFWTEKNTDPTDFNLLVSILSE